MKDNNDHFCLSRVDLDQDLPDVSRLRRGKIIFYLANAIIMSGDNNLTRNSFDKDL